MEETISTTKSTSQSSSAIGMILARKTVTRFIAMPVCNIATGQILFDAFSTVLSGCGIPWSNVVDFCSDSASVMVGSQNLVESSAE